MLLPVAWNALETDIGAIYFGALLGRNVDAARTNGTFTVRLVTLPQPPAIFAERAVL